MSWPYAYTPYIWPMLATAALLGVLGAYAWRRRYVAAAFPFVLLTLFWTVWALASALELAAADDRAKFFWFLVQAFVKLPNVSLALVFVLVYAGLNKWITRTTLTLLALPCVILPVILVTNPAHHLFWTSVRFAIATKVTYGPLVWAVTAYIYLLFLLQVGVLVWFWLRSPLYRWPVSLMLGAQFAARLCATTEVLGFNPVSPLDPGILSSSLPAIVYFFALFRFRILDVIPAGREAAFEDMANGLLILNSENQIADINATAQKMLGVARRSSVGHNAADALAAYPDIIQLLAQPGAADAEITLNRQMPPRFFQVQASILTDRHGLDVGRLVLLRDITEQKVTRELLVQQQRMLAVVQERERLARELHDSIGQVLGYAGLQLEATLNRITDGQAALAAGQVTDANTSLGEAGSQLTRLSNIVHEAHADVRENILNLRLAPSGAQPFFATLRHYLDGFSQNYGVQSELLVGPGIDEAKFDPGMQMQLFRIIQEALSNARKHARASRVQVSLRAQDHQVCIQIQDNGQGFDPMRGTVDEGHHYGLQIMRERAEQMGGNLVVRSAPGQGTTVVLELPLDAKEREEDR
jgi:signal transduction histidine kinase